MREPRMATRTQRILERDNYRCQYCGGRAFQADHIVPVALRRRHKGFDCDEFLVAADTCNARKGTRRYAPPGFDLTTLPGTGWQIWDGGAHLEVLR